MKSKHQQAVEYVTNLYGDSRGSDSRPEYKAFVAGWEAGVKASVPTPASGVASAPKAPTPAPAVAVKTTEAKVTTAPTAPVANIAKK